MALLRWLTRLSPRNFRLGLSTSSSSTAPQRATRSTPARGSRGVLGAAWDAIATIIVAFISVMRIVSLFVLAYVAAAMAFTRWVAGFAPPMVGPWSSNPGSSFDPGQSPKIATEDDSPARLPRHGLRSSSSPSLSRSAQHRSSSGTGCCSGSALRSSRLERLPAEYCTQEMSVSET